MENSVCECFPSGITSLLFDGEGHIHDVLWWYPYFQTGRATHHFLCLVREMRTQGITATQTISITRGDHKLEFSNRFTLWVYSSRSAVYIHKLTLQGLCTHFEQQQLFVIFFVQTWYSPQLWDSSGNLPLGELQLRSKWEPDDCMLTLQ